MESKLASKRQKFSQQIRRTQINTMMTECRSKMVGLLDKDKEDYLFLDGTLQTQPNNFSKIKLILKSIRENRFTFRCQQNVISKQSPNILCLVLQNAKIKANIELNALQSIETDGETFTTLFKILAKEICTKVHIMNINFKQSLKITFVEQLATKITTIYNQLSEIIEIIESCDFFLTGLASFSEEVSQAFLKELTSCLIELSCFKPRNYSSQQQLQMIYEVNNKMSTIRQLFNTVITSNLYQYVKSKSGSQISVGISINIIYIFGNIFVSLSSKSAENAEQYKELHELCFTLFKDTIQKIAPNMRSECSLLQQSSEAKQFQELASVMVWFVRNQILILQGIYKTIEESISQNNQKQTNQQWVSLLMNIIQFFSKEYSFNHSLSQENISTLLDIISLLKLLRYDFNLPLPALCHAVDYLRTFLQDLGSQKIQFKRLSAEVYELSTELFYYRQDQINVVTQNNKDYLQLYSALYQEATQLIKGQKMRPECFKICSALLSTFCTLKKVKQPFYQQICSNFQALVSNIKGITPYQQTKTVFSFIFEILKQFQHRKCSQMQNELLSYGSLSVIVNLCSRIWQSGKRNDDDVICTLNMLRMVAENEEYVNLLKEVLKGEGYFEQLENLQAESSEEINRLAYEICQLLEIQ